MARNRLAIAVLGLCLLASLRPAFAGPKVAAGSGGAAFVSTKFQDETQNDLWMAGSYPWPQIRLHGCNTVPELNAMYASQIKEDMLALGFVPISTQENNTLKNDIFSPFRARSAQNGFSFQPKDATALKAAVGRITWIGTRQKGPISGTVDRLVVSIVPQHPQFSEGGVTFEATVVVTGSWHGVPAYAKFGRTNYMGIDYYNSAHLVDSILPALRGKGYAEDSAKLAEAFRVMVAETQAMADDWAKISAENGYAGKLPANYIAGRGLDGSFATNFSNVATSVAALRKNGGDTSQVLQFLTECETQFAKDLKNVAMIQSATKPPAGMDLAALKDSFKIMGAHDQALLDQIKVAKGLL